MACSPTAVELLNDQLYGLSPKTPRRRRMPTMPVIAKVRQADVRPWAPNAVGIPEDAESNPRFVSTAT